jgi:hypothetical protein
MLATIQVRGYPQAGGVSAKVRDSLAGALGPLITRLEAQTPPIAGDDDDALRYTVEATAADDDGAFREVCRQVGLVFALSRLRSDWSFVVSEPSGLLLALAGAPSHLWIRDGAAVLRHADAPRGQEVVSNDAISAAVGAELAHGLGETALRWLGLDVGDGPASRRAALEARRAAHAVPAAEAPRALHGPTAGSGDLRPFIVETLDTRLPTRGLDGVQPWQANLSLRNGEMTPVDGIRIQVALRDAAGALLDVAEGRLDGIGAGESVAVSAVGSGRFQGADVVVADAWVAIERVHRLDGVSSVRWEEV